MAELNLIAFSDDDAKQTIVRALRTLAILAVIAAPLVAWKMGWRSAVLLLVGAAVSAAGLWKWLRLITVLIARMDMGGTTPDSTAADTRPPTAIPTVLLGFFLTLGLMVVALYGSLKLLDGSVYALFVGLALGIVALTIEALRLVKAWTI